jgi:hypothetical protein
MTSFSRLVRTGRGPTRGSSSSWPGVIVNKTLFHLSLTEWQYKLEDLFNDFYSA